MSETIIAILLGIVEGITEYLPISSTGHLILFGDLLQFTGEKAKTFDVVIQLGAILAVVWLYSKRFVQLIPQTSEVRDVAKRLFAPGLQGVSGLCKLGFVTGPALLIGATCGGLIKEHLFNSTCVAIALALGGVLILVVERFGRFSVQGNSAQGDSEQGDSAQGDLDHLTWQQSVIIGCVQCLALWPGMSRAASAIIGGMIAGLSRKQATEFSFLAAVPILTAAAVHDLFKAAALFTIDDLKLVAIGLAVSFITALLTVKWFISIVGRWSLRPFAYYRLVVAALVFWLL